jgi:hypothetical protein
MMVSMLRTMCRKLRFVIVQVSPSVSAMGCSRVVACNAQEDIVECGSALCELDGFDVSVPQAQEHIRDRRRMTVRFRDEREAVARHGVVFTQE